MLYSIAAKLPGNILVEARSEEEALRFAREGHGEWEEDDGADIEIVEPPSITVLVAHEFDQTGICVHCGADEQQLWEPCKETS
ncbi:MAG: hypothetical protein HYS38_10345 [Acidobacteria bacterium]|nr:hypothetical protein [Acidobacteriota bacterium]